MFKKILCPIDLSDVSPKMAPFIIEMATKHEAEVHLLFVVRVLEHFTALYVPDLSISKLEQEMIAGAEKRLEEFTAENFSSLPTVKASVVLGDASEEIVNYVNKEKMDLVIVGTHGRKGLEKVFFGSVAEKVVKTCPVPVLSINPYREREA
ncbi:universal stress protein [Desulfatibacillum aliphaticivorans]|uniref:universal stress protein n=1 Tax=Desulfatibacillum aliphaticivorans TaxID=218208 RepID=UPI000422DF1C|nr:universal stress protein [Desulfatibacillum aliphaticivorans]